MGTAVRLPAMDQEPLRSYFRALRQGERVVDVDAKVAHGVLDLAVAEQDLNGPQISGRLVDDRCLGSPERMGAILRAGQTDPRHPLIDKAGILPRAEMIGMIDAAWEDEIIQRSATTLKPGEQAGPGVCEQLELHGTFRLLLDDHRPRSDLTAADQIADLHADDVATAKLAVDREVEQRAVANPSMLVQKEPDLPYLPRLQSSLCAYRPSSIPSGALLCAGVRDVHRHSPAAEIGRLENALQGN